MVLSQGLSLLAMNANGALSLLATAETCDPNFTINGMKPWAAVIEENPAVAHIILSHDSAYCGDGPQMWHPSLGIAAFPISKPCFPRALRCHHSRQGPDFRGHAQCRATLRDSSSYLQQSQLGPRTRVSGNRV